MTQTDSLLVVVSQGEIDRTHAAMKDAIRRAENAEAQLAEARALLRDAVAQTLAGNALGVELSKALAEIEGLTAQLAEARAQIAAYERQIAIAVPKAKAWDLQHTYAKAFADNLRGRVSDVDLACLESEYEAAATRAREVNRG